MWVTTIVSLDNYYTKTSSREIETGNFNLNFSHKIYIIYSGLRLNEFYYIFSFYVYCSLSYDDYSYDDHSRHNFYNYILNI